MPNLVKGFDISEKTSSSGLQSKNSNMPCVMQIINVYKSQMDEKQTDYDLIVSQPIGSYISY